MHFISFSIDFRGFELTSSRIFNVYVSFNSISPHLQFLFIISLFWYFVLHKVCLAVRTWSTTIFTWCLHSDDLVFKNKPTHYLNLIYWNLTFFLFVRTNLWKIKSDCSINCSLFKHFRLTYIFVIIFIFSFGKALTISFYFFFTGKQSKDNHSTLRPFIARNLLNALKWSIYCYK